MNKEKIQQAKAKLEGSTVFKRKTLDERMDAVIKDEIQSFLSRLDKKLVEIRDKEMPKPYKEVKAEVTNFPEPVKEVKVTNLPEPQKQVEVTNFPEPQTIPEFPDVVKVKAVDGEPTSVSVYRDVNGKITSIVYMFGKRKVRYEVRRDAQGKITGYRRV